MEVMRDADCPSDDAIPVLCMTIAIVLGAYGLSNDKKWLKGAYPMITDMVKEKVELLERFVFSKKRKEEVL